MDEHIYPNEQRFLDEIGTKATAGSPRASSKS